MFLLLFAFWKLNSAPEKQRKILVFPDVSGMASTDFVKSAFWIYVPDFVPTLFSGTITVFFREPDSSWFCDFKLRKSPIKTEKNGRFDISRFLVWVTRLELAASTTPSDRNCRSKGVLCGFIIRDARARHPRGWHYSRRIDKRFGVRRRQRSNFISAELNGAKLEETNFAFYVACRFVRTSFTPRLFQPVLFSETYNYMKNSSSSVFKIFSGFFLWSSIIFS